jgi:hypothetical protein
VEEIRDAGRPRNRINYKDEEVVPLTLLAFTFQKMLCMGRALFSVTRALSISILS